MLTFQTDTIPFDGGDCLLDGGLVRYQTTVCVYVCVCVKGVELVWMAASTELVKQT